MRLSMMPLLNVADLTTSIAFYRHLGFTVGDSFEEQGTMIWARLEAGDARLMLNRQDRIAAAARQARPHYGDVVLYLYVGSAQEARDRLAAAGLTVSDVERAEYGQDEVYLRDPDGYEIATASPVPRDD